MPYSSRDSYLVTNSRNNHDDMKRPYSSQWEAEEVVERMRSQGCDENGTLQAYYNPEYGQWFVGNRRWCFFTPRKT
jgi:hypothetical protein